MSNTVKNVLFFAGLVLAVVSVGMLTGFVIYVFYSMMFSGEWFSLVAAIIVIAAWTYLGVSAFFELFVNRSESDEK